VTRRPEFSWAPFLFSKAAAWVNVPAVSVKSSTNKMFLPRISPMTAMDSTSVAFFTPFGHDGQAAFQDLGIRMPPFSPSHIRTDDDQVLHVFFFK